MEKNEGFIHLAKVNLREPYTACKVQSDFRSFQYENVTCPKCLEYMRKRQEQFVRSGYMPKPGG